MCVCACVRLWLAWQIGTTKGTGGDVLILEEAAYCDEGFFYETVAPILSIGTASLVAISTLTSEINFYTRLIKMIDPATSRPLFTTRCIELCCEQCKEDGKSHECVHMLHLVPSWQSEERHRKLKIMVLLLAAVLSAVERARAPRLARGPHLARLLALVVLLAVQLLCPRLVVALLTMHRHCLQLRTWIYRCRTDPTSSSPSLPGSRSTRYSRSFARVISCLPSTPRACRSNRTRRYGSSWIPRPAAPSPTTPS